MSTRPSIMTITDAQWDLVLRYLALFLEGMPEVVIDEACLRDPTHGEVVRNVGGAHTYILWSFGNFLEQVVPERGEPLDRDELERARMLLPTW